MLPSPHTSCPVYRSVHRLSTSMGKILVIVALLLGGACPVQMPSTHLIVNSTQKSFNSYLISCTAAVPEEQVTQVHWKERHSDGHYSLIAVQNPYLGNFTQPTYKMAKLNRMDDLTYTLEIEEADKVVCCEVVTFPSGLIRESCLTIEGDSVAENKNLQSAFLGMLVVAGFFIFGSFVLLCHICWKRKTTQVLSLRRANQQLWNRDQTSNVPYTRTSPSINHGYEAPLDADLPEEAIQRTHLSAPGNQMPSAQRYTDVPPLSNQWLSEASVRRDNPAYPISTSAPPQSIQVIPENSTAANQVYSNVLRHNRRHPVIPHVQSSQNQPAEHQPQSEPLPFSMIAQSASSQHYPTAHMVPGRASNFPEDPTSLQPPRLRVPRTPDSPFSTANPMYNSSRADWAVPQGNTRFKYQRTTLS
ncbi:uncharacterized protein [Hyperolius riggenbachi]|uniref:uncharacterized protein isoform X2 n=1 Tax=Hyperolius riggenbachi TaxID=752182 RepID=UPI0035A30FD2